MRVTLKRKTELGVLSPKALRQAQGERCYPSARGEPVEPRRHPSILVLLLSVVLASCATFPGKQPTKKPSAKPGTVTTVKPPDAPPREIMRPESVRYADVSNPKRQVSQQLVAQGKEFLTKKDYNLARSRLEEAIVVDPTNGSAYYHLAVVYYELGDHPKALGFLDQAESLFHASPEWVSTIGQFRTLIQQAH